MATKTRRMERLNSLLKEVLSEVICKDLTHCNFPKLITVTEVDVSPDIRNAKVFISIIESDVIKKEKTIALLQDRAGQIAFMAARKVTLRYFPELRFKLDESASKCARIEEILKEIRTKNL